MFEPSRSDLPMLARALAQGWNIPPAMREKIINVLFKIASEGDATKRERTSAARALMQASRVELDAIRVAQGAQYEDMLRRLEALEGKGGDHGQLAKGADGD